MVATWQPPLLTMPCIQCLRAKVYDAMERIRGEQSGACSSVLIPCPVLDPVVARSSPSALGCADLENPYQSKNDRARILC